MCLPTGEVMSVQPHGRGYERKRVISVCSARIAKSLAAGGNDGKQGLDRRLLM